MSDFGRPPKKQPRAGKGTFRQANGLHPLVERRMYFCILLRKTEKKENEHYKNVSGTREALEAYERFCSEHYFPHNRIKIVRSAVHSVNTKKNI